MASHQSKSRFKDAIDFICSKLPYLYLFTCMGIPYFLLLGFEPLWSLTSLPFFLCSKLSVPTFIGCMDEQTTTQSSLSLSSRLIFKLKDNLSCSSKWSELNGAMDELGTYIPIVLALTLAKDLNVGTTLLFTGIYNIIAGIIYGVPMPVQPMKSIAAVAISSGENFGIPEIMAAGTAPQGSFFYWVSQD